MKSRSLISSLLAVVSLLSLSVGQSKPEDYVLAKIIHAETAVVQKTHPDGKLFEVVLLDFVPLALGTRCSAHLEVRSGFLVGSSSKYEEASGQFSACDGAANSSIRLSENTFKTVPCKPRYAAEETNKICGGQLDETESEELHRPLQISSDFLHKTFDSLRNNGVDLGSRYDLQLSTAARIVSVAASSGLPEVVGEALIKLRSVKPDAVVALIRGRQARTENGETIAVLVDVETGSILGYSHSTPLTLEPPTRPQ
jgi:hypothetical protein